MPLIHRDDALWVVAKPAGLLSVPGRGPDKADCAAARVQAIDPRARVVHRLDMATSGLLVFALGVDAQRTLSAAFEQRLVDKRYGAVVHGLPLEDAGEIDLPLAADWPARPRQKVDAAHGRPSLTRWWVLARDTATGCSRLVLQPVTGRTHQLRVHLAAIGHPIVGDTLYGPTPSSAQRLLLHATDLRLPHPTTAQPLVLHSPAPF